MYDATSFFNYLTFERHYSNHTVAAYKRDIRAFGQYLVTHTGLESVLLAQHIHVRSWLVHLMQDEYSSRSINRKLSSIKSLYKYLKRKQEILHNPAAKVSGPKNPKRLPQIVRVEEIEKGLSEVAEEPNTFGFLRDRLIIDLLYHTGMRRAELIHLKISDLNYARKEMRVIGKGNKERIIPMSPSLISAVDEYMILRKRDIGTVSPYLLVTDKGIIMYPKFVYLKVNRWISRFSTIKKKSPHILRHSFATHLADNGAELNAIKELLGHANLSATQIYTHNSISRLKEVYGRAHPKGGQK